MRVRNLRAMPGRSSGVDQRKRSPLKAESSCFSDIVDDTSVCQGGRGEDALGVWPTDRMDLRRQPTET